MDAGLKTKRELILLTRLTEGNEDAFISLYNHYKTPLYISLVKLLKDRALVEDTLQNLFTKVWDTRQNIDPNKPFKSYLYKIASNMVADYYRKSAIDTKVRQRILNYTNLHYTHIEEKIFATENAELLNRIINILPPQRRSVFRLKYLEEKSYDEISNILGISSSTINDHLQKAKKTIQEYINQNPELGILILIIFNL